MSLLPPHEPSDFVPTSLGGDPLSEVSAPPTVTRLGNYDVIGKLGEGGMAEVFLAVSRGTVAEVYKLVVVKRMKDPMRGDKRATRMFLREAKIATRLNHANVVNTYTVEVHDGYPVLVMEYLDGVPLSALMRSMAGRPWHDQLPLLRAASTALRGLHYVHEFVDYDGSRPELVHRDIKPGNIFVTFDGQIKLLDFGVAKPSTSNSSTHQGLKGTAQYMAPEMVTPDGRVDRRADIFSFGVTLWEIVKGTKFWADYDPVHIVVQLANGRLPALPREGLPEPLFEICKMALEVDPKQRFPSAESLKAALDGFLATLHENHDLEALVNQHFGVLRPPRRQIIAARLGELDKVRRPETTSLPALDEPPRRRVGRAVALGFGGVIGLGLAFAAGRARRPSSPVAAASIAGRIDDARIMSTARSIAPPAWNPLDVDVATPERPGQEDASETRRKPRRKRPRARAAATDAARPAGPEQTLVVGIDQSVPWGGRPQVE